MPQMKSTRDKRDTNINVRVRAADRELIDDAAHLLGKSRTEFVLESARREAEAVLLDRRSFRLEPAAHRKFLACLDAPPALNERLRALLASKSPWE